MHLAFAEIGSWERDVLHWVTCRWHAPWLPDALELVQHRGVATAFILLGSAAVAWRSPRRGLRAFLAAGLGIGVALSIGTGMWPLVDRQRPGQAYERTLRTPEELATCAADPDALAMRSHGSKRPSFPSHHALTVGAVATAFWMAWRPLGALTWLLGLVVGWARLYFGKHWPTDVLGGLVLGAACGWASWRLVPWVLGKARLAHLNEPPAPEIPASAPPA